MKKLVLLLSMITMSAYAQKDNYLSVSYGADIKNGLIGSKPTGDKPALNWIADFHAVGENIDFGVGMEKFDMIDFTRLYVGLGYHFYIGDVIGTNIKFFIQPSLEWSNINRTFNKSVIYEGKTLNREVSQSFSTPSFNINWNWDLNKYVAIQIATSILPRPDKRVIYNETHTKIIVSEALKVVIKLPNE